MCRMKKRETHDAMQNLNQLCNHKKEYAKSLRLEQTMSQIPNLEGSEKENRKAAGTSNRTLGRECAISKLGIYCGRACPPHSPARMDAPPLID